jgi:hypothetical protein
MRRGNGSNPSSRYSNEEALLRALHQAEKQQVAAAPAEEEATTAAATTTTKAQRTDAKGAAKGKEESAKETAKKAESHGKVLAKTKNGTVHQVTGFEATKATEEADTKLVEESPEQTGENYIKAQQNLPDVVVVGGEGPAVRPSPLPSRSSSPRDRRTPPATTPIRCCARARDSSGWATWRKPGGRR